MQGPGYEVVQRASYGLKKERERERKRMRKISHLVQEETALQLVLEA